MTNTATSLLREGKDSENLVEERTLRLCTFNAKRGFFDSDTGRPNVHAVMSAIGDYRPDILGFSEAFGYHQYGRRGLLALANQLTDANNGIRMEPYVAEFEGHANHPVLFVNTAVVQPDEWWEPHMPHTRQVKWGWMRARVWGVPTYLSCQHWQGGLGRHKFWEHASAMAYIGAEPAIALGDFNATSGWAGERDLDWHESTAIADHMHKRLTKGHLVDGLWQVDTTQMDFLRLECGWRDLGEDAGDGTATTAEYRSGLRIDRIMLSESFPGRLMPGTYAVHEPPDQPGPISDHKMVTATVCMNAQLEDVQ